MRKVNIIWLVLLLNVFNSTSQALKGHRAIEIKITDRILYMDSKANYVKVNYRVVNHSSKSLRFYNFVNDYWWNQTTELPDKYQSYSMGILPFFQDSGFIYRPAPINYHVDEEYEKLHPESNIDTIYKHYIQNGFTKNEYAIHARDSLDFSLIHKLNHSRYYYDLDTAYNYTIFLRYVMRDEIFYRVPQLLDVDKPKIFFGDIKSNKVSVIFTNTKRRKHSK